MMIDAKHLISSPEDGTLVTEASTISLHQWPREFVVVKGESPKIFTLWKVDLDASGEEVAGYRYRSADGQVLLIIND